MEFVSKKLIVLIFGTAFGIAHTVGVLCAKPDGDKLHILHVHHTARIVGGRVLDTADIALPLLVDLNAIVFSNMLNDEGLHHFSTIQAQSAVVHSKEYGVRFVFRWCVDF